MQHFNFHIFFSPQYQHRSWCHLFLLSPTTNTAFDFSDYFLPPLQTQQLISLITSPPHHKYSSCFPCLLPPQPQIHKFIPPSTSSPTKNTDSDLLAYFLTHPQHNRNEQALPMKKGNTTHSQIGGFPTKFGTPTTGSCRKNYTDLKCFFLKKKINKKIKKKKKKKK